MSNKAVLFYTDNAINMRMAIACRKQLAVACGDIPITCVSRKPMTFGAINICIPEERGYLTMYKQILAGLEATDADIIYFAEHDVLYHKEHFNHIPSTSETWAYAGNYWMVRMTDGFAIHYNVSPLSGLVVYREPAIKHFKERIEWIKEHGFGMILGFEPMTHHRIKWNYVCPFEVFMPSEPNIDLCHGGNLSHKRWRTSQFIRKPKFWVESDVYHIPGWPNLPKILAPFFPQKDGLKFEGKVLNRVSKKYDLSVLIPARNEMFLARTVQDILEHAEGNTEVIAVLDGAPANPPVQEHDRVRVVTLAESIGQRAATNLAARMSTAKYVLKCDAHCSFDQGFDVKLMADMKEDWTTVPIMRNLWAFDWVCPDGHRRYQGPPGVCKECGKETTMDVVWIAKNSPQSKAYCFDPEPHFQYHREFSKRPEGRGELTETMSLQGSCWMLTRDKYWDLNICDESFGSWGSQGIEVAVKTWLSGGRVICNQKTFYAHMFRTQGEGFGFPYPLSGNQVDHAKKLARDLFFNNKWPKQVHPLSWLVEKFWPIPGWRDEDLAKLKNGNNLVLDAKSSILELVTA